MIYNSHSSQECWFWYKALAFGECFASACILHFFLVFTGKEKLLKKGLIYAFLYIPSSILLYGATAYKVVIKDFIIASDGHVKLLLSYDCWYFFFLFLNAFYISATIVIAFKWRSKLKYPSEKKQALVIILPDMLSLLCAGFAGMPLLNLIYPDLIFWAPATTFFGTVGTWYASVKYELITLTPSLAADSILDTVVDSVILVDSELKILTVNKETCRMLRYSEKELIGEELKVIFGGDESINKANFAKLLRNGPIRNYEVRFTAKGDITIPVSFSASEYRDKSNSLLGIIIISRDITERKNADEHMKYLAHHDFLTCIPNRLLFVDRLEQALIRAQKYSTMAAVMLLDVDGFKEVNDVMGHNSGDNLLVQVAERLKPEVRKIDTIARFGGDEFIFIVNDLKTIDDVTTVAEKIRNVFKNKFIVDSRDLYMTASVGISLYPCDGMNAETLIKNADLAMYHAKDSGKNNYQLYTRSMTIESSRRMSLENSLRKAIEGNEFVLYYQPIVDVITGKPISIEALVRWQHPEQGLILPGKFIPFAEETGLITKIGEWVLRTACMQNKEWINQGVSKIPISVNLSSQQFKQDNLVEKITGILEETGLEPDLLELEITESTAMLDTGRTASILNKLKDYGVSFIIDDFGIGYSSLNHLRRFPIKAIKIDNLLIHDITKNSDDAAIATAIFAMAHAMNLKVIAEGVETLEQLEFLRNLQWKPIKALIYCGAQGYYFSKPVPAESFAQLIQTRGQYSYVRVQSAKTSITSFGINAS